MNVNRIENILSIVFSRPPASVGLRINSERKLASAFEASPTNIHRILDVFVEKGILTRHHGNGTFIRKVSSPERFQDKSLYRDAEKLVDETLCLSSSGRKMKTQQLQLSLWSDFPGSNETNTVLEKNIIVRAKELGHSIVTKSLIRKQNIPLGIEEVAEEMRKTSHDGYIIIARWVKFFEQAAAMAWGKEKIPTCYIMPCSYFAECEPYITLDTDNAMRRAIRIFAQEGYKKIGMMLFDNEEFRTLEEYRHIFKSEAGLYDFDSVDIQNVPLYSPEISYLGKAIEAILAKGLEAVYVADDNMLPGLSEVMKEKGIVPGKDLAIITSSNRGLPLPGEINWSRMEFDLNSFSKTIIDSLLNVISTAGENMLSFSHQPAWRPGKTHLLKK